MDDTYTHPQLGTLFPEDTDWIASSVTVPFSPEPIEICLASEEEGAEPPHEAIEGYDWVSSHWPEVFRIFEDQAFAFYEPYRDAVPSVPQFDTPGALLGTEQLSSVRVFSKMLFEVSLRFQWQEAEDPHTITFYIEDGVCRTHSVDG